jgi:hypothetical protein
MIKSAAVTFPEAYVCIQNLGSARSAHRAHISLDCSFQDDCHTLVHMEHS